MKKQSNRRIGRRELSLAHSALQGLETRTLLSGWTTVDDYRYIGSPGSGPYTPGSSAQALTVDASGQLYAGGFGRDADSFHSLVKRSPDAGRTYYYFILTLLNSDGASAPSATVSGTTSA